MKLIRKIILKIVQKKFPQYHAELFPRASVTEVGFKGQGFRELDREIAKEKNLKVLNWFERWILKDRIASEKIRREMEAGVIKGKGKDNEQ